MLVGTYFCTHIFHLLDFDIYDIVSFDIKYIFFYVAKLELWGSKVWARDLGPGTTFHQQYARGEEITEDRCN